jgi:uncharacterized alkaline shock family protein YloU
MVVPNGKRQSSGDQGGPVALQVDKTASEVSIKELEMLHRLEEIEQLKTLIVRGSTNISEEVIGAVANQAASEVEGVAKVGTSSLKRVLSERIGSAKRKTRGVGVEAGRKEAILDISVRLFYGYSIPQTVIHIRRIVADRLLKYCGLVAKEVNIKVVGLEFPERLSGRVQ